LHRRWRCHLKKENKEVLVYIFFKKLVQNDFT
jgi:hypothetical protein